MGDRGNIAVIQSNNQQVWFYGHWSGWRMPAVLQHAIREGKGRWRDESYFARIVFCRLVRPQVPDYYEETSYGISTRLQDNERPVMVADCNKQIVYQIDEGDLTEGGQVHQDWQPKESWTFQDYAELEKLPWGDMAGQLREMTLTKTDEEAA